MEEEFHKMIKNILGLIMLSVSAISYAAPVAITNAGFETDQYADGGFSDNVHTGWTSTGGGTPGTFNPTNAQLPGEAPEGDTTLFLNGPATVVQVLTTTLIERVVYTLQVEVCDRVGLNFPVYAIGLYAGGTLLVEDSNTLAPTDGCLTSTITYTSPETDPNVGQALEIRLSTQGVQVNFDNVRLEANSIAPVPTMSQWMLGLLALILVSMGMRRRYMA